MTLLVSLAWYLVLKPTSYLFFLMLLQCGTTFLLSCALYNLCLFLRKASSTTGTLNNYFLVCILVLAYMLLIRPCIVCKIVIKKKKTSGFSIHTQSQTDNPSSHQLTDPMRKRRRGFTYSVSVMWNTVRFPHLCFPLLVE